MSLHPCNPLDVRKNRKSRRSLFPWRDLPTPPAGTVRVERVLVRPIEPWFAIWVFSEPVEDPTEAVSGFLINNTPGQSWGRESETSLMVDHGISISAGMPWSCAAGAGGVRTADGKTLEAGEGSVGEGEE